MITLFYNPDSIKAVARVSNLSQGFPLDKPMTLRLWRKLLAGEHSPIRELRLQILITDIPYYAAMHIRTHQVALDIIDHPQHPQDWQCVVRSQRPDGYNPVDYDRREARQDAPVSMLISCNPQSLIDVSRKRLCGKADEVTRSIWQEVKNTIALHNDVFVMAIALYMLPDCDYRGGKCHQGGCAPKGK